jgi:hypothetical protein
MDAELTSHLGYERGDPAGWTAKYANDGDYNTEWKASSSTYPSWWEVDLGQEYNVKDVQLSWWMIGGSEATEDFQIQVSDDNVHWSVAYDLSSGDKQYGFNDAQFPSVLGRYVRVKILGSHTQNNNGGWYVPQLYEARVFGDPAPYSSTVTTPDANGSYSLQVPSYIDNYPATGSYTFNLGDVSIAFPTADLLSHLGNGALTVTNGKTPSATRSAITAITPASSKVADTFDLSLTSADGTSVGQLDSPAGVTVQLSAADITSLSGDGTPAMFYYDPATKTLVNTNAVFDLAKGTVNYNTTRLGTYVLELTNIPASFTVTTKPVVQGTAAVGKTLTVTSGSYSVGGVSTAYQWLRDGAAITGATGTQYTVTAADYQAKLSVMVTASKPGYTTVTTTTAATAAVAAGTFTVTTKPVVQGTAAVGKTLTVTSGSYSVSGVSTAYQWLHDGKVITGATGTQYTVTSADSRTRLSVRVTASKPGYTSVTTTTATTSKVR